MARIYEVQPDVCRGAGFQRPSRGFSAFDAPQTPHSLWAGDATFYKMQNMSLEEVALIGRWSDFSTAKSGIDIIYAILPETIEAEKRVKPRTLDALEAVLAVPTD